MTLSEKIIARAAGADQVKPGEIAATLPCTPRVAVSISASTEGGLELAGK